MSATVSPLSLPTKETSDENVLMSRFYYTEAHVLEELQTLASSNRFMRNKLESFSAFLWKLVAKQAGKDSYKTSKLGVVVDGRKRLVKQESNKNESLMEKYFGNVLSIPFGDQRVDDLIRNPLSWAATEIHKVLKNAVTKDHFLSLIDWVETRRPKPALSRVYSTRSDDRPAIVVSSDRGFPVTHAEFGWGLLVFVSYHFPWGGTACYVMLMPSSAVNGDWMVYLHLAKGQLKMIENEASHVFKPMNSDYLKIN